jgi:hypothetical protein
MWPALKPSDRASIVGAIDPVSTSSTVTSGWIDAAKFNNFIAIVGVGVLGASATVDAKLQQATDSSGTGAKDITGKAITQFTKAGTDDAKQTLINLKQDDLDVANSFNYFRLSITDGTAASLVTGYVLGFDPRYGPATDFDATTVDEVVG